MDLKELVDRLSDEIWTREQHTAGSAIAILSYVQDTVSAEVEYRRRRRELERRLAELEGATRAEVAPPS